MTESGRYTIDGTNVVLDKDDAGMKYFAVHPDGLQMLDIHQKPISGALSRNYLLTRVMPPTESSRQEEPLMEKKLAQGIDFYAFGNEPFWSVDIDFEKGMRFKSLTAAPKLNTPPAREDRAQDADVTRYYAQTEAGTLIVTVLGGECIDSMSGEQFPFRVRAEVKRSTDTEYTVFEGCGRYVEDNRLEDTWKLTAFGGRDLKAEDFGRGLPEIAFNLEENRVTGNSGCNRFAGRLQARGNRIIIRQTASTRMACPNMTFEDEFLSAITNHTLRYRINEDRLVLTNDQEVDITFKKTE